MFRSMTAYGRGSVSEDNRDISVEIRSVNSKYLDLSVRLPRQFQTLEPRVKTVLTAHGISRGRIEVSVNYSLTGADGADSDTLVLDEDRAAGYIAVLRQLRDRFGLADDISVMTVAQNKDIFVHRTIEEDPDTVWELILPVLESAIDAFLAERVREGENIRRDLAEKIAGMRSLVEEIARLSDGDTASLRDKLRERIGKLLADSSVVIDESRILTECAVMADRIAIDEELVRLRSHFDALEKMADSTEPVGRKFDFQLQETGREINTIGSKCQNADIAGIVVKLKNEAEKLREQIQNIE